MTAVARFKQSDVTRAVKGAKAAGIRVSRIEIDVRGNIVVLSDRGESAPSSNPWDTLLHQ